MTFLLDTHALLWAVHEPGKLSRAAREAIEEGENLVYFSAASVWEIAIKCSKNRLSVDGNLLEAVKETKIQELPITSRHSWKMRELPMIHADPFDRMLVAQAMEEGMVLISKDRFLSSYPLAVLEA